ncbi:MAG: Sister chromatid cohesion protein 2 [Bathelium mastoideum]|nr:MAG: Sister chromatid cohesion protein 2 [Bathelium mastoideum]
MNGQGDGWGANLNRSKPLRFPTADEAIQYTPFTSIVPFSSDMIPIPAAYPPPSSVVHFKDEDRKAGRALLRSLNQEITSSQSTGSHTQHHLGHLQQLLKQEPPPE